MCLHLLKENFRRRHKIINTAIRVLGDRTGEMRTKVGVEFYCIVFFLILFKLEKSLTYEGRNIKRKKRRTMSGTWHFDCLAIFLMNAMKIFFGSLIT